MIIFTGEIIKTLTPEQVMNKLMKLVLAEMDSGEMDCPCCGKMYWEEQHKQYCAFHGYSNNANPDN